MPASPFNRNLSILLIARGILILGFLSGLLDQSWMTVFVAGLSLALTFLPTLLRRWRVVDLPLAFEVAGALFVLASLFLGEIHGWYTRFWWWDLLLHATSAMVIAIAGYLILTIMLQATRARASPWVVGIFTVSFALAIGTLWEITEYVIDLSLGTNMQRSGLTDTMTDLMVDAVGAFIAGIAAGIHTRDRANGWLERLWRAFYSKNPWFFRPEKTSPARDNKRA